MSTKIFRSIFVLAMILVLAPACAKQDEGVETKANGKPVEKAVAEAPAGATEQAKDAVGGDMSIMDKPVNFSTPEDVDKSIEAVRQAAGEPAARELNNALKYILFYDLSLGRNKEKMYQKYNGQTPNEIIANIKDK